MPSTMARLDKSVDATLGEGYGTVTIRVVVVDKAMSSLSATGEAAGMPIDAEAFETLPESGKRPVASFLEESKRGKMCCVFLINGQRQHGWDNQFIVRDLELKYLRNRMVVVVDCDGLKPETIAELMQGSRSQFYEGNVYAALESRVVATLKGDPDLHRLEEEAEDEISSLRAGDEAVKAALDQLIEDHHETAARLYHGHAQAGDSSRQEGTGGPLSQTTGIVRKSEAGPAASEPVLRFSPDVATIRLKPDERRQFAIFSQPEPLWKNLESHDVRFEPPLKELEVTRKSQLLGEEIGLTFIEPKEFDDDAYPIETSLRSTVVFKGYPEPRTLERRVVINPPKTRTHKPSAPLIDEPTFIKLSTREPIRVLIGGPDVHVKLRWDGNDELVSGSSPLWTMRAGCESPSVEPPLYLTKPTDGRFELLIQPVAGLNVGDRLEFEVEAVGPGRSLTTSFVAVVIEAPSPRRLAAKMPGGGQRRPPYDLRYVDRTDWVEKPCCWDGPWSEADPGSFVPPNTTSPLTIFINQDMDLLVSYRERLLAKKLSEVTITQRITNYTAHVAFHLYQMYENKKTIESPPEGTVEVPPEGQMRDEIRRVARTLLKLMEVTV